MTYGSGTDPTGVTGKEERADTGTEKLCDGVSYVVKTRIEAESLNSLLLYLNGGDGLWYTVEQGGRFS